MNKPESAQAISAVDDILASVGLGHGSRKTRTGCWQNGERQPRQSVAKPAAASRASASDEGPLRAADWQRYAWLRHGFSQRAGGLSTVYSQNDAEGQGTLNLGWTEHDSPANVAENRRRFLAQILEPSSNCCRPEMNCHSERSEESPHFARSVAVYPFGKNALDGAADSSTTALPIPEPGLVTLRQIHSGIIRIIEAEDCADPSRLSTPDGYAVLRGDGAMTDQPGVYLGIQTADCVPVLVADVRKHVVAAFHAGWRGTLGRIVERGIGTMRLRYGSRPQDLVAAIGPSIGPCCYSVGEELRFDFHSQFAYAPELFTEVYDSDPIHEKYPLLFLTARAPGHSNIGPQIHLNLWEANRRQLVDAGVSARRITVVGECTACSGLGTAAGRKYFSHRAESGFTGRMMSAIGMAR
ncbi:MAG: peptidoglycan editing factor PgeF [Acidobacteriaceae bacterium]|nr:peptidoglycan editing factor PgeF [Acidobacteriaceae bacterium]